MMLLKTPTIAIIASKTDEASRNIVSHLTKGQCPFTSLTYEKYPLAEHTLYVMNDELVHLERIDRTISADFFLFLSKHASRQPIPALTVHTIGNFSRAELGGQSGKLVPADPKAVLLALRLQQNAQELDWEYFQEVTHHGPYLEKPALFMEIGSTKEEWSNTQAGKLVAENVRVLLQRWNEHIDFCPAIGIGGLHNAIALRRLSIEDTYALGHICPKYMLEHLDEAMIRQMLACTPGAKTIVLDWKGLGSEKTRIMGLLEERFKDCEIIKKK